MDISNQFRPAHWGEKPEYEFDSMQPHEYITTALLGMPLDEWRKHAAAGSHIQGLDLPRQDQAKLKGLDIASRFANNGDLGLPGKAWLGGLSAIDQFGDWISGRNKFGEAWADIKGNIAGIRDYNPETI